MQQNAPSLLVSALTLMALCLTFSSASAALVWRPGEGWVNESNGQALAASDARAQLQVARQFEAKEDWSDALQAYQALVRRWKLSSVAAEAQFKSGFMLEKMGEFWAAYKQYKKLVQNYPSSKFFDLALERQHKIGNLHLAGEPQKIWKLPMFPSMEKTVEIYNDVINSAPYGKWAAPSQFKIGQARENQKNWSEAIAAYQGLIDKYPGSDLADDAQYQIGYAWYKASSSAEYDQSAAEKSVIAFSDFITRYPTSEKIEQAKEYMTELNSRRVEGSYNIARFYESQGNWKAAFIYYNEIVKVSPDSKRGKEAKAKLDELRPKVDPPKEEAEDTGEEPDFGNTG